MAIPGRGRFEGDRDTHCREYWRLTRVKNSNAERFKDTRDEWIDGKPEFVLHRIGEVNGATSMAVL